MVTSTGLAVVIELLLAVIYLGLEKTGVNKIAHPRMLKGRNHFHSPSGGQMLWLPRPAPWSPPCSRQSAVVSRHLMKWGAWVWAWNAASSF